MSYVSHKRGWIGPTASTRGPGTVAEVQAVVRIAGRFQVPLWTNSMGKNNAYGGGAPRLRGSVVMSLRRMNRILEVNEELAYAVVEPGVSFFDLCTELRRRGNALWASIPDLGWGSVVGNALDHGFGYLPEGDHAASQCGMEVVLADGSRLRTGGHLDFSPVAPLRGADVRALTRLIRPEVERAGLDFWPRGMRKGRD